MDQNFQFKIASASDGLTSCLKFSEGVLRTCAKIFRVDYDYLVDLLHDQLILIKDERYEEPKH